MISLALDLLVLWSPNPLPGPLVLGPLVLWSSVLSLLLPHTPKGEGLGQVLGRRRPPFHST